MIFFLSLISSILIFRPSRMNLSYFSLNFLCCSDCMNLIRALESGSIIHYCRSGRQLRISMWFMLGCAFFLLTSCNSKKYLREDQSFLKYNEIKSNQNIKLTTKLISKKSWQPFIVSLPQKVLFHDMYYTINTRKD